MSRLIEFAANHWVLVSVFVALLAALVVTEQRRRGKALKPQEVVDAINREGAVVVDVRDRKEFAEGHIVDAVNVPYAQIKADPSKLDAYRERPVVVVCKIGQHSGAAAEALREQGFAQVQRLSGGMAAWRGESLPVVKGSKAS
ncbi:MAG: rhodanese-like domain-containing protein [Pseudomonadota bacterium]|nr:rhodanese-like domain-containing protein [Pseudomonadota bacterium]